MCSSCDRSPSAWSFPSEGLAKELQESSEKILFVVATTERRGGRAGTDALCPGGEGARLNLRVVRDPEARRLGDTAPAQGLVLPVCPPWGPAEPSREAEAAHTAAEGAESNTMEGDPGSVV